MSRAFFENLNCSNGLFKQALEKWHSDSVCIVYSNINSKLEPQLFHLNSWKWKYKHCAEIVTIIEKSTLNNIDIMRRTGKQCAVTWEASNGDLQSLLVQTWHQAHLGLVSTEPYMSLYWAFGSGGLLRSFLIHMWCQAQGGLETADTGISTYHPKEGISSLKACL